MLECAALNRWGEIVELLVTMDDLFPSLTSPCAEAVLLHAAEGGHKAIVDRILATGKADLNAKSLDGMTPLAYAASKGYADIVIQLLSTGRIEIDTEDSIGRTPLAYAVFGGHAAVVRILLSTGQVDPDHRDMCGSTPLFEAAANGHEDVIRQLLAIPRADTVSAYAEGQKALCMAELYRQNRISRMLEDWLTSFSCPEQQ